MCNAVLDVWQPAPDNKVIINLPVTVEMSLPHVYASQVEYMCDHLHYRENVIVSLHPHNDRGCAVADTELGLLGRRGPRWRARSSATASAPATRTSSPWRSNMFAQALTRKASTSANLPLLTVGTYERADRTCTV